jgi:membrane protease YdiL (CAAX protease family)
MPLLPTALLLACLTALAWLTWRDIADYAAFKQLTLTADRQRRYRAWALKSFLLFFGGSVVCLVLLGRLGCLIHEPREFFGIARRLRSALPVASFGPELLGGMAAGVSTSVVIAVILAQRNARRAVAPMLGDVGALLPRNAAETGWTALLAVNAGISEEVFFRLLLPLLLVLVFGNAALAFAVAGIVFGLAHVYQGWVGVLATFVLGLVLTGFYLVTDSLLAPIVVHVLIDLVGLVIRPTAARLAARR